MTESPPPLAFGRQRYPAPVVRAARAVRRWRAPLLTAYAPRSTLRPSAHEPVAAAVPAVDFHTHLGRWLTRTGEWMEPDVGRLMAEMDEANVRTMVNLDGRWGQELEDNLDRYDRAFPGRFVTFCHVDWRLLGVPGGVGRIVESFQRSVAGGARGLKVWKDLGLSVRANGRRVLPDDPTLGPLWEAVGDAGVPVLIHVADPAAFFQPADRHNERLEELLRHPAARHGGGTAEHSRLIDALEGVVASHPRTRFVCAHGCCPEDLARLSRVLGRYDNLSIDISAAASQLGRQPRAAAALIELHAEKVLFGTDVFPLRPATRRVYFRLLETDDEAFAYSDEEVPPNGRWPIYGLALPVPVLERVYRDNASALLGLRRDRSWPGAAPAQGIAGAARAIGSRI